MKKANSIIHCTSVYNIIEIFFLIVDYCQLKPRKICPPGENEMNKKTILDNN